MKGSSAEQLPLAPLLEAYTRHAPDLRGLAWLPGLGPRCDAVLSAGGSVLGARFLDLAGPDEVAAGLVRFYAACVGPPLHEATLQRRAGVVRHGLSYLLRGQDTLPAKVDACLGSGGPYQVPGLGPSFWSALLQGLHPVRHPGWTPATVTGLRRLGLAAWDRGAGPGAIYAALVAAYARIRALAPTLSALHIDHFLTQVAAMSGRNLPEAEEPPCRVERAVRQVRQKTPLRDRLKQRGRELAAAQEQLVEALKRADGRALGLALAAADPAGSGRSPLDWGTHAAALAHWVAELWEAGDPYPVLAAFWEADPLPGAGLWLPAAVLHLRDPQTYAPWDEESRHGYATLDDAADGPAPPAERYRLFNEGVAWLRRTHGLHPLEVSAVLAALAPEPEEPAPRHTPRPATAFGGFCADTFRFLAELAGNNRRDWMERQRDRYRFAVREPLAELCRALVGRYVEPVLRGVHGWDLDAEPVGGRALTRLCKNTYGRSAPYNTALWIAFCRRAGPGRRVGAQFFVRLDASGLRYGLRLGPEARAEGRRLHANLARHAGAMFRVLRDNGALAGCRFGPADEPAALGAAACPDDLLARSAGRSFEAARTLPPEALLLRGEDLVGDVLLTFDRLVPLYACAVEEDVGRFLGVADGAVEPAGYGEADFRRDTFLGSDWLRRARELLTLKGQMILHGVPGTGKTHVARCLARLLTGGRDGAVRLVQLHPAFGYEEFVEGIKVRSVAVDGRHDVTYPVEDGLLCSFAAQAERHPAEPHVLVIDEINRGNLPRIFGELLYLLEYRGQAVVLPCSGRDFRLPPNLYLVGTMNAADRSAVLLDQALRRRFSFVALGPDPSVLAAWLRAHATGPAGFGERVLGLFDRLNARLRADLGPQAQVGHSYFMVPGLDEARLRIVWQHHVRPLLDDAFAGQPGRAEAYDLDRLLDGPARGSRRRPAGVR